MFPDISTSSATAASTVAVLAVLHVTVWRRDETYPGFGRWTAAMLLFTVGLMSVAFKLASVVAWVLVIGAFVAALILALEGCREFRGMRPRLWSVYLMSACVMAIAGYFEYTQQLNIRIGVTSSYMAVMALGCCVTLFKNAPAGTIGSRFTAGVFGAVAVASSVRVLYYQFAPALSGFYDISWVGAVSFSAQSLFLTCCMFGWLVMANERRLGDLKQEQAMVRSLAQRAAAADAAKTEVMAALGHEVRNPLTGLAAVMELMLGTELTSEQREYVLVAGESIGSLLRMTEDILKLSKMQSNRPHVESRAFDLRNQIEGLAKMVRPLTMAKGVEFVLEFLTPMPPLVLGDEGRIRQVMMNLLMNAVKYTPQGLIRIAAAFHTQDATGGELEFTVSDTGIGIATENLPTLFEKGGGAHAYTERAYGGSGIGLVMCKSLLDLMGGRLEVESQVNQGSSFKFSLPLQVPDIAPAGK